MTFQYLAVSCIPAIGYVPNISRYDTRHLFIVTDISRLVRYMKFILDCS